MINCYKDIAKTLRNVAFALLISIFSLKAQEHAKKFAEEGLEKFEQKDWQNASKLYSRALDFSPNQKEYLEKRGWAYLQDGRYRKAMHDFDTMIDLDKANYKAWIWKAVTCDSMGRYEQSHKAYLEAIKLVGNADTELYVSRGNSFLKQKDYRNAIANLNVAIQIDRKNYRAYYLRGLTRYHLVDMSGCCSDLGLSMELGYEPAKIAKEKLCQQ
jgi:tetratricopeptide (TPR) repeat protein